MAFLTAALALTVLQCAHFARAANYLITFGDSYSQTGFNVSSTKPSSANPLGNPSYPGWTTSGGPNWIGYLAKEKNTSALYSYNFADGGATVNASLVKPFQPTVKSLIDQVQIFSNSIAKKPSYAPWTSENAFFGIWLGVNDIGNSYSSSNESQLLGQVLDDYFEQADILYTAGARNFIFLNVPPIYKTPTMLAQSNSSRETETRVIEEFNQRLVYAIGQFIEVHQGAKGVMVDTQAPFDAVINDPTKYGSANATCYNSDGKTCIWYNDYHPGQAIHKKVAEEVAAVVAASWDGSPFKR